MKPPFPVHKSEAEEVVLLVGAPSLDLVDPEIYRPHPGRIVVGISVTGMIVPSDYIPIAFSIGLELYDHLLTPQQYLIGINEKMRADVQPTRHLMLQDYIPPKYAWYGQVAISLALQINAKRLVYVGCDMQFLQRGDRVIKYSQRTSDAYREFLPDEVYQTMGKKCCHYPGEWQKPGFAPVERERFKYQKDIIRRTLAKFPQLRKRLVCHSEYNWLTERYR